jgi:hypothetical protein
MKLFKIVIESILSIFYREYLFIYYNSESKGKKFKINKSESEIPNKSNKKLKILSLKLIKIICNFLEK